MCCSESNYQVRICKQCYETHDENEVKFLVQPHNINIELNPEEYDQAFDITVRRHITDIEDNEHAINN